MSLNYLTSCCLGFLICDIEIRKVYASLSFREGVSLVKCLEKCLAHTKNSLNASYSCWVILILNFYWNPPLLEFHPWTSYVFFMQLHCRLIMKTKGRHLGESLFLAPNRCAIKCQSLFPSWVQKAVWRGGTDMSLGITVQGWSSVFISSLLTYPLWAICSPVEWENGSCCWGFLRRLVEIAYVEPLPHSRVR